MKKKPRNSFTASRMEISPFHDKNKLVYEIIGFYHLSATLKKRKSLFVLH